MSIEILSADLQNHEALKDFGSADDLAKSFIDIKTKASSGSLDLLPEDIRNNETIKQYKTLPDAMKGLIETKKFLGTVKRPPATAKDYKFTAAEGVHPSIKDVSGFQNYFAEGAHKLGLAEDQADGAAKLAVGYFSQIATQVETAREESRKNNEAALRQEWGADYDKNFNGVIRALTKAAGKDAEPAIAEIAASLKNAPLGIKALAKLTNLLSEDSIEALGGGPSDGGPEGDEKEFMAMEQAVRTNDQKHPLMNEKLPGHQGAKEKWAKLSMAHFATK